MCRHFVHNNHCLILLSLMMSTFAGCDATPLIFNHLEQTSNFIPEVKAGVEKVINAKFGQPDELVVDEMLPFKLGGIEAKITAIADDRKSITVDLAEGWKTLTPGNLVMFPGVSLAPEPGNTATPPIRIASTEESAKKITLNEVLPAAITIENDCLLDAGRTVKSGQKLYMQHCVHCHGASGDGNGPSAPAMNPRPRDFRLGKFKYTSTFPTERAHHQDLERILREGIAGTYMPSFRLLEKSEMEGLVAYILFLGTRGELEGKLCAELDYDYSQKSVKERLEGDEKMEDIVKLFNEFEQAELPGMVMDKLTSIKDDWDRAKAPESQVVPKVGKPDPDAPSLANPELTSVMNGYQIYMSKKAQCTTCHGDTGRGDGYQARDIQKDPSGKEYPRPGLHDDWGNHTPPRDLTAGIMRGGKRPVDVFRRIYAGIKGTRMLAFGGTGLTDEEIWDVVNYLMVMPELNGQPPRANVAKPQANQSTKVSQSN